jgi:hypothetical protein
VNTRLQFNGIRTLAGSEDFARRPMANEIGKHLLPWHDAPPAPDEKHGKDGQKYWCPYGMPPRRAVFFMGVRLLQAHVVTG